MWTLIITILFYGDPVVGKFSPALSTAQFKSKNKCEAARTAYLSEVKPTVDQLNTAISDEKKVGQIKGPNGVLLSAICVSS